MANRTHKAICNHCNGNGYLKVSTSSYSEVHQCPTCKSEGEIEIRCRYLVFIMALYDFTSLINNRARVYKGGSWKDRAYWMSPGGRRFLDEMAARDDIGFRCAMTKVGSQSDGGM